MLNREVKKKLKDHDTQLEQISNDDTFKYNHFLSHLASYIGIMNTGFTGDDATRYYIIPRSKILTGVGGAIKVFGDNYYEDALNYRDMGLYFSADQNNENGFHNTGAFYINSKVNGEYSLKNPDIIFSFQDGADIGARFVRLINSSQTDSRATMVVGEGKPIMSLLDEGMVAEFQGNLGLLNGKALKWLNSSGSSVDCALYYTNQNKFRIQALGGIEHYINNQMKCVETDKYTRYDHAIVLNTITEYSGTETTISASGTNLVKLAQSGATTITSITGGQNGHELTLYFTNGSTTLKHNNVAGGIVLVGGVDYKGSSLDVITLIFIGDRWFQKK